MPFKINLSSKNLLMIILLCTGFTSNADENFVYVTCEAGRWEGNSIDTEAGGEVHLTYSKRYGGGTYGGADEITTQSFMKKCKVDGYNPFIK